VAKETNEWPDLPPLSSQVETEDLPRATVQRHEARTQPQQGRLSRPVRTLQQHNLAGRDVEFDAS